MTKTRITLSIISLSLLAACATREPVTPAPVVVTPAPAQVIVAPAPAPAPAAGTVIVPSAGATTAPMVVAPTLRFGHGRIESIAANPSGPGSRIAVKMDDGTVQYLDTRAPNLGIGDRVEVTRDGFMRHPA